MVSFAPSELILNTDGSIYHLHLQPEQIADLVITVGDPERVGKVSRHFDRIDERVSKREFVTHTGELAGRRISVISTGIGTDNIDIVFNELDALARVDLGQRALLPASKQRQLTFVRLGTSGTLQPDLPLDSLLISTHALGLDGLMPFYELRWPKESLDILDALQAHLVTQGMQLPVSPYLAPADPKLVNLFSEGNNYRGITLTAAGFYGPQARQLRLRSTLTEELMAVLRQWNYTGQQAGSSATEERDRPAEVHPFPNPTREEGRSLRITNFEMETAGIYGLAYALGHRAISISALLANRANATFSSRPGQTVDRMIEWALHKLCSATLIP